MTRSKRRNLEKRRRLEQTENRRMRLMRSAQIDDVCYLEGDRRGSAAGHTTLICPTVVAAIALILAILAAASIR